MGRMGIRGKMGFMGIKGIIGIIGIIGFGGDAWENRHRHTEIRTSVDVQPQNLWTFNHRTYGCSTTGPVDVQPRIGREHHDAAQS